MTQYSIGKLAIASRKASLDPSNYRPINFHLIADHSAERLDVAPDNSSIDYLRVIIEHS